MLQPLSSTNRVMMVGLSSKDLSLTEMSVLAQWNIKPRLTGVPGVANVAIWGQREQQLQVQVDPNRLRQNGITLNQVVATTGNALWVSPLTFLEASTPGTGGFIDTPNQRLGIQHILPIRTPQDLSKVIIQDQASGKRLSLGEVATVVENHQPLIGDALVDGGPGLMLVVEKFPGANTLEVTKQVEQALAALAPGLSGVDINTTVYRPATFIDKAIGNLSIALALGLLLLLVVLGLLFFEWRTTLIGLVAILASVSGAWLALNLAGYGINAMILAGLVIAAVFVIADAVSDVFNIARRLRERRQSGSEDSAARTVLHACLETRGAMTYATLIILIAAAPVLLLPELTGVFFRQLALAFVAAVLVSSLVSLTVVPALALVLLRNAPLERRESPFTRWAQGWYPGLLSRVMRRSYVAYGLAAIVALAGAGALLQPIAQSPIPALQERNLLVRWDTTASTSATEMLRITEKVSRDLRSIPGVRDVGAHVGRAITSDQVVNVNSGELWVSIDPAGDYDATLAAIRAVTSSYPGLDTDVQTYPGERIAHRLGGDDDAIVVRVYGQDLDILRAKATEVRDLLATVGGVVDPLADMPIEEPTVQVKVDLAKAQQHGVKPGDVRRAAAALLSGIQVGSLFEEQKVFEVVVWGTPEIRNSLTGIRDLVINTPSGGHVRLGDVADVSIQATPNVIERDSVSRYIDIGAGIRGRDYRAVADEIDTKLEKVAFPIEYHAELIGSFEHQEDNQNRLLVVAAAALIAIFLLLQAAVGSWRLTSLLFLTLLVAVAGGLIAGLIGGISAISSLAAFVAVVGIAARMLIQQVKHYQYLERREGVPFGPDLVTRGAGDQVGSIIITTLATAALLLPLLFFGGVAGLEILRPIVVVILGGLIVSALLNLFIVPALYLRFGADSQRDDLALDLQPGQGVTQS
jgi:Cu/Ag efflux pump CusA